MLYDIVNRQIKLRNILCCPNCKGDLEENFSSFIGDFLISATLDCRTCANVGVVCNGRVIFGDKPSVFYGESQSFGGFPSLETVDVRMATLVTQGQWTVHGDALMGDGCGAALTFRTDAIGVNLDLLMHNWSGVCEVFVNNKSVIVFDLYEENGSIRVSIPVYLGGGDNKITLKIADIRSPLSHSSQCHFFGYQEIRSRFDRPETYAHITGNRGNVYPECWHELLDNCTDESIILDCGSGDRRFIDERVFNFEYCQFGFPDIFGDGHHLPFRDGSFDLILSQAVFEHLYDPFKAAEEIMRVIKPGGVLYVESAFMQPLHAVPFHFFNTTPWGLERLFPGLQDVEIGSHGTLGHTLTWIYDICNFKDDRQIEKVKNIIDRVNELDTEISNEMLRKFSSFVSIKGTRPH